MKTWEEGGSFREHLLGHERGTRALGREEAGRDHGPAPVPDPRRRDLRTARTDLGGRREIQTGRARAHQARESPRHVSHLGGDRDGRLRPDLGVRRRPADADPRQGRRADRPVRFLVRAHGRARAQPRDHHAGRRLPARSQGPRRLPARPLDARAGGGAGADRMRRARLPLRARAGRSTSRPARSAASRCRRACARATSCRSRSSRRPPRPRPATTRTSPSSAPPRSPAARRWKRCAT